MPDDIAAADPTDTQPHLRRDLANRHIQLIAIGGAIGTGLFMGSGRTISLAGPAVMVVYGIIGFFVFFVLRAMGELLLSNLNYKSFVDFAADLLGPAAEKLERLGLWGLMPRTVYDTLIWCIYSGVHLPPPLREMQEITLTLDRAINSVIDRRLAEPTNSADLLNVLLSADGGIWPRQRVRDEALTFMLAGHETTANAMSWFWYLMALNPQARDHMLTELDDVLGMRRPTADDLGKLAWTTACLQESQRYFSSVWIIAREAVDDDIIDGHRIRRGTTVVIPIHHIHHDPRWWPDPDRFDPGRFLRCPTDRPRCAYLPFGGGRRICIGQSFALMEMVLMAAIMSQHFTFDLAPGYHVELEATLTLRPKHGVHVIGRRR